MKLDEGEFHAKLSVLCAAEASAAHGNAERFGVMVESVARALGFTVAMACRGHGPAIDEMMAGAEGYAHAEATHRAPFARFMSEVKADAKRSRP